jgi:hypothetical protein
MVILARMVGPHEDAGSAVYNSTVAIWADLRRFHTQPDVLTCRPAH